MAAIGFMTIPEISDKMPDAIEYIFEYLLSNLNTMKRIMVVEDHPIVAATTSQIIRQYLPDAECREVNTFRRAVELIAQEEFDLVVMDLSVPGGNTVDMIARLRALHPQLRVLIFTGLDEALFALPFIKAGANGFLSKKSPESELRRAIDTVLFRNKIYVSDEVHDLTMHSYFKPGRKTADGLDALSQRELEIVRLFYARKGVSEIASILHLSTSTINTHRVRIFRKMDVENLIDLVMKYEMLINGEEGS